MFWLDFDDLLHTFAYFTSVVNLYYFLDRQRLFVYFRNFFFCIEGLKDFFHVCMLVKFRVEVLHNFDFVCFRLSRRDLLRGGGSVQDLSSYEISR